MARKTQDGAEALQWCGRRPGVTEMVFFTGHSANGICPGGDLIIEVPGGDIQVDVGQWVVKKGGKLEIVDNDKIALVPLA